MRYIGWHKGATDDGYITSSRWFNEEYRDNPQNFERTILAQGSAADMAKHESNLLDSLDVMHDPNFYNQRNGSALFFIKHHTRETRELMSRNRRGKPKPGLRKPQPEDHKAKVRQGLRDSEVLKNKFLLEAN